MAEQRHRRPTRTMLALTGVTMLVIGILAGYLGHLLLPEDGDVEIPVAGSVAVGFAQDMSRHHEQGTEMATIAISNGTDPEVRTIAFDILTVQTNEIGQMQSWLTRWGHPLINTAAPMRWMDADARPKGEDSDLSGVPDDADAAPMPGMATQSEMDRLRESRGTQVEVLFLQLILRHHQGALPLIAYAADEERVPQGFVRDLAAGMLANQQLEIEELQRLLAVRGGEPLPLN